MSKSSACADNTSYVSSLGLKCAQHNMLHCQDLGVVGLSDEEVKELMDNCPTSCRIPPCLDDGQPALSTSDRTQLLANDVSGMKRKDKETTPPRHHRNQRGRGLEAKACFKGWDVSCQDDSSYMSPIGLECDGFQGLDCKIFLKVGFAEAQVLELVNTCPCACGIECGTWTMPPTFSPTERLTSSRTDQPTAGPTTRPSPLPTNFPTKEPTLSPSGTPTLQPVTSSPTKSLSALPTKLIPTTGRPTTTHSSVPSANPTARRSMWPSTTPSSKPSLHPSNRPSYGPIEAASPYPSAAPTVTGSSSPSSAPSATPSRLPSASPSASPSTFPSQSPSVSPSTYPSVEPSPPPSASPSSGPTTTPTSSPSATPSIAPSGSPSHSPSKSPTAHPTQLPSYVPSQMPFSNPSGMPSVSLRPSVSFAPSAAPTSYRQRNRLPNRASIGGGLVSEANQGNDKAINLSLMHLVILCVSVCGLVAFGVSVYAAARRNSRKRREKVQTTKEKVRYKFNEFKRSRRGIISLRRKNSRKKLDDAPKRKEIKSRKHGKMLAARNGARKGARSKPSVGRVDAPNYSNESRRRARKHDVYKGAECMRPISRGGKKDTCTVVVETVDSVIKESRSTEVELDEAKYSGRREKKKSRHRAKKVEEESIPPAKSNVTTTFAGLMENLYSFNQSTADDDRGLDRDRDRHVRSRGTYNTYHRFKEDLTLTDLQTEVDDAKKTVARKPAKQRRKSKGLLGGMANEVTGALKDLGDLLE